VKRAPAWMRSRGLEWLHRLISEPRRLWRRYLVLAPKFVVAVAQEQRGR
jgi:N-acetylglucosaminyldiphosphoundecaprenol N-acetyl-beta-D-mannosaminyltransferase